jgi:uncharacterized protein
MNSPIQTEGNFVSKPILDERYSRLLSLINEIEDDVARNTPERCYHCKKREFGVIQKAVLEHGIKTVLDGSNLDDLGDYRPGLKALVELGIKSPLWEAGLTNFACLASRIPYGETITAEKLSCVEKAEAVLRNFGIENRLWFWDTKNGQA